MQFAATLEHSSIAEAVIAFEADYDMIEHSDAHDLANFFESAGDFNVFLAGSGITAGVIVDEYNRRGGFADHGIVDFPRMNQRCGQ